MTSNIVLVVMDTARAREVSELVEREGSASTIGRLIETGTEYANAYATSPWTLPSHASMFTGTYPSEHGAHAGSASLRDDLPTLAGKLSTAGYRTVGFTNNPWVTDAFGLTRGFDRVDRVWQYVQSDVDFGQISVCEFGLGRLRAGVRALFRGNALVNLANAVYGQFLYRRRDYGARRTNALVEEWLADRGDADRPYFLFLNYLEPHLEYRPPREYAERYLPAGRDYDEAMAVPQDAWAHLVDERRLSEPEFELLRALYRAEIAYLDDRLGDLVSHLRASGEWEDTVFVLCGDHGENVGDHGLMDHQYSVHDTVLHVPLVVTGGAFEGGGTVESPVQLCDLYPTLLDAARVDHESTRAHSFHPERGPESGRDLVFGEYLHPQPSVDALEERFGELPERVRERQRGLRTVRTDEYKLVVGTDGTARLYETSGAEEDDVGDERPEVRASLRETLEEWSSSFDRAEPAPASAMSDATRSRLERLGYLQ